MISIIITVICVVYILALIFERYDASKTLAPFPDFRIPFFGDMFWAISRVYRDELILGILDLHLKLGAVFQLRMMHNVRMMFISDPEDIKYVLLDNFDNYVKGPQEADVLHDIFGGGIFAADGEEWKTQRQMASSLFHFENMQSFVPVFVERAKDMVKVLGKKCVKDLSTATLSDSIDMQQIFARYTMDSIGEIGFGVQVNALKEDTHALDFCNSFDYIQFKIVTRFFMHPLWKIIPDKKYDTCLSSVNNFMKNIVQERRNQVVKGKDISENTDLLSVFLRAKDEAGQPLFTDQYLLDILKHFLVAGRDTTAVCLTWAVMLLAQHPDIQSKVLQEIYTVVGRDIENLTYDKLGSLKYMQNFINETLRLYPSIPSNIRSSLHDDVLPSGFKVPARTMIQTCAYAVHRLPNLWNDPNICIPDRWDTDVIRPYQFIAFHGGPRICLGKTLAYQEIKVALCAILMKYQLHLAAKDFKVEFKKSLSLPPKNGMNMYVTSRCETVK
eukprot:TRINITY_DN6579_c0_g1_i3.p1 TRINITY_DN6579_c0_g1~~TRINITY_DN6579_c0_g1_i3.p1  ORF type:complete len:500 (-),score=97.99 TRINITY_DN6579_c0_g1_i3:47-1546(-)